MNPVVLHQTGLTLLHFVWQGALVAGLLWVALRYVPSRRADIRYALALVALAALCVCPLATYASLQGHVEPITDFVASNPVTTVQQEVVLLTGGAGAPAAAPLDRPLDLPSTATLAWAIGVFVLAVRLAAGLWRAHQVTRRRVVDVPEDWQVRLAVLAEELGIRRPVRLIASELLDAPATVGILKAVVLVPCSFLSKLPEEMVEGLLLHELAHIRRHDYLLNIVQTVVETVLFYHPAVWWVSHVVRAERENCCDDIAVGATGDCASYAKALTMLEERRAMALAVSASGGHLMKRIRRILSINSPTEPAPAARPAALVVTIAVMALAATVLANTGQKKATDKAGPDVKIDREAKSDLVALAPTADIGSIADTVKESDYKGVPVPVVKFDVVPGFFQTGSKVVPGQALHTTYAVKGQGTVVVFADGRKVTADGLKTEVVTAVPNDPQGSSYSVSLPGRYFATNDKIKSGETTYISVEPAHDGSYVVLRAVEAGRGRNTTRIKSEGDDSAHPRALKTQGVNVALVAPRSSVPSAQVVTLHPSPAEAADMARRQDRAAAAPVAVPAGAIATVAVTDSVAVAAPALAPLPARIGAAQSVTPTARVALAPRAAQVARLGETALAKPARGPLGNPLTRSAAGTQSAVPAKAADAPRQGIPVLSEVPIVNRLFTVQAQGQAVASAPAAKADRTRTVAEYAVANPKHAGNPVVDVTRTVRDYAVARTGGGPAAPSARPGILRVQDSGRVTLMAEGAPLSQIVRDLVEQSDISVLIEAGDYQRVTLFSRNLEPEEALILAVRAAKGEVRREGKTWIISPRSGAPVRDRNAGDTDKVASIDMKNVGFTAAIENLSRVYGFKYSIDTDMSPISVSTKIDNANLSTALQAVCLNVVHYRVEGGTYHFGALKG